MGEDVRFISYLPRQRTRRDGIPDHASLSLFYRLLPLSAAALFRYLPKLQNHSIERIFSRTDLSIAARLPRCDVLIGLSAMTVGAALAARERYGAKVVIERGSRHVLSQQELVRAGGARLSELYLTRELASYRVADRIGLPSSHAVQSFVDQGEPPERLFQNAYGVDLRQFTPSPRPDGPIKMLFVGQWSIRKGADIMTAALERLPNMHLTHVGTQADQPFPSNPRFATLGHLPHAALGEAMKHHHMLLLASREDGFGMVLLEALASGLPVVASTMTGAPDLRAAIEAPEWVELVEPANVESLVTGIEIVADRLATGPADRELLSSTDRAFWSWRSYAERYRDYVYTLAGRHA